jgi:hypothetical protein
MSVEIHFVAPLSFRHEISYMGNSFVGGALSCDARFQVHERLLLLKTLDIYILHVPLAIQLFEYL